MERLLETVDIVVYLLDWTKLKTQEEADLLKRLRDINPQLFARLSTRLFFCVNKADAVCWPMQLVTCQGLKAVAWWGWRLSVCMPFAFSVLGLCCSCLHSGPDVNLP